MTIYQLISNECKRTAMYAFVPMNVLAMESISCKMYKTYPTVNMEYKCTLTQIYNMQKLQATKVITQNFIVVKCQTRYVSILWLDV